MAVRIRHTLSMDFDSVFNDLNYQELTELERLQHPIGSARRSAPGSAT